MKVEVILEETFHDELDGFVNMNLICGYEVSYGKIGGLVTNNVADGFFIDK